MRVFLQPAVPHFHESKLQLHHLKDMLDLGPHLRLCPVLHPRHLVHNLCSDSVVGCSLAPAARPDGSLPFVPDRLHRPTLASLLRAVDRARSRHQKRWPPSPPPCESVLSCCPPPRAPSFRNTTDFLFWSDASPDRAFARGSWSTRARE